MNYVAHYDRLISRARTRTLVGYRERHHVLPRCMGGGDAPENIVALTAEEHYVAHQLLVKIYPSVRGLAIAAVRMAKQCTGNKAFGWLRRRNAAITSITMRGNKYALGQKDSPETLRKKSLASSSRPRSREQREKIRKALLGRTFSAETKEKMSKSARRRSVAARENMAKAQRGKIHSLETRAKMSSSQFSRWSNIKQFQIGV